MGRRTGKNLLDDEPLFPPLFEHLWSWFFRLSRRRGGGFGPSPLTHQDIFAWATLSGITPNPWEVLQLEMLDDLYLKMTAKKDKEGEG